VPRPITKPSMARRPFQVSANATNPKQEADSVRIANKCKCNETGCKRAWQGNGDMRLSAERMGLGSGLVLAAGKFCTARRLSGGSFIGLAGLTLGLALAVLVLPHSGATVLLLFPYLLWSPVGTLVSWQMPGLSR